MNQTGVYYVDSEILGFRRPKRQPAVEEGTMVLHYDGWTLLDLLEKQRALFDHDSFKNYPWAREKLPSGLYVLRLPIPDSNCKSFDEQKTLLLPREDPAHVVLATSSLLSIKISGRPIPVPGHWIRTGQQTSDGVSVRLSWANGLLDISDVFAEHALGHIWLSGARKIG